MKPGKVLYVSPNARLGGAEQLLLLLARHHRRDRWVPSVYFLADGPLVEVFRSHGIECHVHSGERPRLRSPRSAWAAVKALADELRRGEYQVVHSVMSYGHVFGGAAAALAGVPETWFQHGPTGRLDWLAGRVPSRTIFVNSRHIAREEARFHPHAGRLRLVYPGIETEVIRSFAGKGAEFRRRQGLGERELAIGLVGRMSPMKGHLFFLESFARARAGNPRLTDARALLIGGPFLAQDVAYERQVRERVVSLGLGEAVVFTGAVEYPQYAALDACDVIVNSSIVPEPFGLTVIEGMALGKAVIAPDRGGPAEVITAGNDGLLFRPDSVDDLARRLGQAADAETRRALGEQARHTVDELFTVERMVREIEDEYERITARD